MLGTCNVNVRGQSTAVTSIVVGNISLEVATVGAP